MILASARIVSILRLCSLLITVYSFSMLAPVAVALIYDEVDLVAFLLTFCAALASGLCGLFATKRQPSTTNLQDRDGFLVAVLFWLVFSAFSALPFIFDTRLNLSLDEAVFEGVSGITTTGASVFSDVDALPKSILFYRAQLNFLGGLGIIVLAVALLPLLGIGGAKLYKSEMPGPQKQEKLTPRLADTAKHLWIIYLGLTSLCTLSYWAAGMNFFDALCHALSTISLGGFSTHSASLGYFNSPAIEWVGGFFSILSAINFTLYFWMVTKRSLAPIYTDPEFRFFISILFLVVAMACIELYRTGTFDALSALTHGFFQAISVFTDNGLAAADFPNWPQHVVLLLLGASFFGGCVGSTCGGIKAMRFLVLYRQSSREVDQLIHSRAIYSTTIGGFPIPDRVIRSVWSLFFFYIFFTCMFIWALVIMGRDLETAFGTVAACINNMGIGYGDTAAGFGSLSAVEKWLMSAAMLFGRLEIFPILVVCSRTFWRF